MSTDQWKLYTAHNTFALRRNTLKALHNTRFLYIEALHNNFICICQTIATVCQDPGDEWESLSIAWVAMDSTVTNHVYAYHGNERMMYFYINNVDAYYGNCIKIYTCT